MNSYNTINGDMLSEVYNLKPNSVDFILVDPPYGTTKCSWDSIIPFNEMWKCFHYVLKYNGAIAVFGQEPFSSLLRTSNLEEYKYDWYWEKERLSNISQVKRRPGKTIETISIFYNKQPTYNPQMIKYDGLKRSNKVKNGKLGKLVDDNTKPVKEYIDTGYRYPTQVIHFQRDCLKSNLHPTQKPVALLEYLIKTYTNENEVVLDTCMGSGSTGIACLNTNRNFIGIELDKNYFNIAKKRIEEYDNKQRTNIFSIC